MTTPSEPKSSLKPARWGMYCGLPWALVVVQFFIVLPRFYNLFRTWKIQLDPMSAALFRFSWWGVQNSRLMLLIVGAVGLFSALVGVRFARKERSRFRNIVLGFLIALPVTLFLWGFVVTTVWNRKLTHVLQN